MCITNKNSTIYISALLTTSLKINSIFFRTFYLLKKCRSNRDVEILQQDYLNTISCHDIVSNYLKSEKQTMVIYDNVKFFNFHTDLRKQGYYLFFVKFVDLSGTPWFIYPAPIMFNNSSKFKGIINDRLALQTALIRLAFILVYTYYNEAFKTGSFTEFNIQTEYSLVTKSFFSSMIDKSNGQKVNKNFQCNESINHYKKLCKMLLKFDKMLDLNDLRLLIENLEVPTEFFNKPSIDFLLYKWATMFFNKRQKYEFIYNIPENLMLEYKQIHLKKYRVAVDSGKWCDMENLLIYDSIISLPKNSYFIVFLVLYDEQNRVKWVSCLFGYTNVRFFQGLINTPTLLVRNIAIAMWNTKVSNEVTVHTDKLYYKVEYYKVNKKYLKNQLVYSEHYYYEYFKWDQAY